MSNQKQDPCVSILRNEQDKAKTIERLNVSKARRHEEDIILGKEAGINTASCELEWSELENIATKLPQNFEETCYGYTNTLPASWIIFETMDPLLAEDNSHFNFDFWTERVGLSAAPPSGSFCLGFVAGVREVYELIGHQLS